MFPILTFLLVYSFAVAWMVFGLSYWEKLPARIGGILFAVMLAVVGASLNTPDCTTWTTGCNDVPKDHKRRAPPETMTNPQTELVPIPYPVNVPCEEKK